MIGATLGKYIFAKYLKICFLIALLISILCLLIDFTQSSARLSSIPHYKNSYALLISTLRLPFLLLQTLPFIILIAALIYFFRQNKYYELVVMRSIGVSAWQFIFPLCLAAFCLGLLAVFVLNPISAYSLSKANSLIANWQVNGHNFTNNLENNPWLVQKTDEGETEIRTQYIVKNLTGSSIKTQLKDANLTQKIEENQKYICLLNTNFIFIPPNKAEDKLPNVKWIYAAKTYLLPGYWLIISPQIYTTSDEVNKNYYLLKTNIKPQFIEAYLTDPNTISFYKLPQKINIAANFGYKAYGVKTLFHYLLALPVLLASMILIAASSAVQFSRGGNIKLYAIGGISAGFILYVIINISQNFAKVGLVSPIIAAWIPVFVTLFAGLSFLLKREDG